MGKEPPPGVTSVKEGIRSAYRSVQAHMGKGIDTQFNMGVVKATVSSPSAAPGKPGAIKFTPRRPGLKTQREGPYIRIKGAGLTRRRPKGRMI